MEHHPVERGRGLDLDSDPVALGEAELERSDDALIDQDAHGRFKVAPSRAKPLKRPGASVFRLHWSVSERPQKPREARL